MNHETDLSQRQQASQRITLVGAIVNMVLAGVKILAGLIGHSHALVADGLHSLADLIADGVVLFAAKYGNAAADHDHPYGHQKIETVAAVFVAIILALTGMSIIVDAAQHLWSHSASTPPKALTLWVALASLAVNEAVYRYTMKAADRYQSALLKAHAWHRRSDAMASLIVIIGIIAALLGLPALDSIAALFMALLIIKMAYSMGRQSLAELIDQGLDGSTLTAMKDAIQQVDGVEAMHQLRTRSMAGHIFADVHVMVNPHISVSEGHYIADQVHQALRRQFPMIKDITVHVDPEDDEVVPRPLQLPSRQNLTTVLNTAWRSLPGSANWQWLNCHYLNQRIELTIALPLSMLLAMPASELSQRYQDRLAAHLPAASVTVYFYED